MTIDSDGNIWYVYKGENGVGKAKTPQEAIRNYFRNHQDEWGDSLTLDDVVHKKSVEFNIDASTGITFGGKDKEGNKTDKPTLA